MQLVQKNYSKEYYIQDALAGKQASTMQTLTQPVKIRKPFILNEKNNQGIITNSEKDAYKRTC